MFAWVLSANKIIYNTVCILYVQLMFLIVYGQMDHYTPYNGLHIWRAEALLKRGTIVRLQVHVYKRVGSSHVEVQCI